MSIPLRAYHLTAEQLWVAYQESPIDQFFAALANTRLAMLRRELAKGRKEQQREPPIEEADRE